MDLLEPDPTPDHDALYMRRLSLWMRVQDWWNLRQSRKWMKQERDALISFNNGMKQAAKYGLELEYFTAFLNEIRSGEDVNRAVWNALYEWDL